MATTSITFTFDNTVINRALTALGTKFGYQPLLPDGVTPNPQSKADFIKAHYSNLMLSDMAEQEGNTLAAAAIATNNADIKTKIIIT